MHCAARLAEQLTCALTAARSWHPIFASTPQVALQEEEHLLSQLSEVFELQPELHWSPHCELHCVWHWSMLNAPAHTARQLPSHWALHVAAHVEVA
jgi:hypothetical protein